MNRFARSLCSIAGLGVLSALAVGQASAQSGSLPFTLTGPVISGSGLLTGNYVKLNGFSDTVFEITGASGSYSDSSDGISGTITGVLPGKTYTDVPNNGNHDSVDATGVPFPPSSYDNILYPKGNSPVVCDPTFYPYHGGQLDIYGLMLTLDLQGGGNGLVNIWSNGILNDPTNPIGLDWGVSDGTLSTVNGNPFYTVANYMGDDGAYPFDYSPSGISFAAVPEPSALLMLGAGVVAVPALYRRRKKQA